MTAYSFALDRFQSEAIAAINDGDSVVVAAPTGAGKTVVAEAAIDAALADGKRVFYTTPIKALSNQKFRDLRDRHGDDAVGLLTGDTSVRRDASIVVMTTEVLRNMCYRRSPDLDELGWVVLDEVHYLSDAFRGPVWEEVVIHTPPAVKFVALSATVSNAEELGAWLEAVRGRTRVVLEEKRPVSLENLYAVVDAKSKKLKVMPTLVKGQPNEEGAVFDRADPRRRGRSRHDRSRGQGSGPSERRKGLTPRRLEVLHHLDEADRLPAIYFIFSRAGCTDAARGAAERFGRRCPDDIRNQILDIAEARVAEIGDDDLDVLGFDELVNQLIAGVAAHHAGMVPVFKEIVEECFTAGLIDVVFATETLALGINMPARAVVIESLSKFTGVTHELLTAGQYTQLTGRAGRRGLDDRGYATVLYSPYVPFESVSTLAASKSFELKSAFRPTYNMTVNLVRRYQRDEATELLGRSFAQFQLDRSRVHTQARLDRTRSKLERKQRERECDHGSIDQYLALIKRRDDRDQNGRRPASARPPEPEEIAEALSRLRPGDVVAFGGRRIGVLSVAYRKAGLVRLKGIDAEAKLIETDSGSLDVLPELIGEVELPQPFLPADAEFQRLVASQVRKIRLHNKGGGRKKGNAQRGDALEEEIAEHPVGGCDDLDKHLLAGRDIDRLKGEVRQIETAAHRRDGALLARFDHVLTVLAWAGAVEGWQLSERGELLAGLHHEADLAMAIALDEGVFDGLTVGEMAALTSTLSHNPRGDEAQTRIRGRKLQARLDRLTGIIEDLNDQERGAGLELTPAPDAGLAEVARRWAEGEELSEIVDGEELGGGDFVRGIRNLADLLRQMGSATIDAETARSCRQAAEALTRGVVAVLNNIEPGDDGSSSAPGPTVAEGP